MPPEAQPAEPRPLTTTRIIDLAWETAWEACIRAVLVLLLGGVAIGIVGGILKDMTPSAPPVFGAKPQLEADNASATHPHEVVSRVPLRGGDRSHSHWSLTSQEQFLGVASIFFVFGMWNRLNPLATAANGRPTRRDKVLQRISEDWFSLIVGNAFGAMIAALICFSVQQFSWSQMLWQWVFQQAGSALEPITRTFSGTGSLHRMGELWHWYGQNQMRFMFWFFYLAAICDDLGLPNFKALGRWVYQRWRRRCQPTTATA